jgi:predicted ATPase
MREGVTQENAAIGETTNLVARLQAIAEPNTLVISPVTHRLVGALFDYRDLGWHTLKGFPEQVHVRQVLGPSKVESRFEAQHQSGTSPLLGREEELGLLLQRWDEAKRGDGRVVLLTGEPGIGKSRLASALREHLRSAPHTPLSYFCSPLHQGSALYPFIGQLNRAAGIERDDSAEAKLDKLQSLLAQSSGNLAEDMPLIAALLSIPGDDRYPSAEMSADRRKERTLAALLGQIRWLASRQPVLMVFEDLHWIDPTSLELLSRAIEQIGEQRILLLATARPEFTPSWPNHRHTSTLSLNRLGRSDGEALITDIAKGKRLPIEVRDQIIGRTDGVPLFVEELTKTVLESGLLRESEDDFELTGPLPPLAIPSTLHASLLARLDRLAAVKDVAQIGAVIGREFSYPLIAAAAALPEQILRDALSQLVGAGLIYQRGVPPDATYQFKHALVQDASYASLVRGRRQQLHSQIARALEERFPDIVATEPETLAHHLTEAGLTEPATVYWLKAGRIAAARSTYQEALSHLERGLAVLATLPDSIDRDHREIDYQLALDHPIAALRGWDSPEFEARSKRIAVLCEKLDDEQHLYGSLHGQWVHCNITGKNRKALEFAERCRALAIRQGDRYFQVWGHLSVGLTLIQLGEFAAAREEFEQSLALYDPELDRSDPNPTNPFAQVSLHFAHVHCICGHPERAAKMLARAFSHAADVNHALTTCMVHFQGGTLLQQILGNIPAVIAHLEASDTLRAEHGIKAFNGNFYKGWAMATSPDGANGIVLMQQSLANRGNNAFHLPYHMSLLAEALARAGEVESALGLCIDSQGKAQQTEEYRFAAELHRIEGEVRRAAGHPSTEIERCLRSALDVSRRQGAKMFELRAATALARLWRDEGKDIEARDLLAPIYDWFTEGFDAIHLKDAKALLSQLSE